MKTNKTYSIITLIVVACLTSLGIQAAPPQSKSVTVVNDDANPVPVTGVVEITRGTLSVDNGLSNPVPVVIPDPVQVNSGMNYRYVGTTATAALPVIGQNGLNSLCRGEFGPVARMCTTKEFFQTPDTRAHADKTGWVQPILVTSYYNNTTDTEVHTEWTGLRVLGEWIKGSNCLHYTTDGGPFSAFYIGTLPSYETQFISKSGCEIERPVTCCTPQ